MESIYYEYVYKSELQTINNNKCGRIYASPAATESDFVCYIKKYAGVLDSKGLLENALAKVAIEPEFYLHFLNFLGL